MNAPQIGLLVLGGTGFLGRAVAAHAVETGHAVTCLARGRTGAVPAGSRLVAADRDDAAAYDAVRETTWDAVVDVGRQPGHVRAAAAALSSVCAHYLYVSSISVYADHSRLGEAEDADVVPALQADHLASPEQYSEAKVACEQTVQAAFGPHRALIARVGLIGGPGDTSGRTGYWPWRFAHPAHRGGAVVVPDDPDVPTAVVDVRDLAAWLVACAEKRTPGVFNAAGETTRLAEHLEVARAVAGHAGPTVPVPPAQLHALGVQAWSGPKSLPLWLDDPSDYGMSARNTQRARAAGLRTRPLAETLADTLAWERQHGRIPHGAGLSDAEELALLATLGRP